MKRYDSYKPSGISWIGEIPSHWNVVTWRSLLQEHSVKNNPIVTRELLALSFALGVTRYSDKKYNMDRVKEDFSQYKIVNENDFVISPNDIIKGSAYRSKYYGCISPMYLTYHSISGDMTELDFFGYYIRTLQVGREFFSLAKGLIGSIQENGKYVTRRMSVDRKDIYNFPVVLPPSDEQKKIVEFISEKTALIDEQQRNLQHEVQLLDELKQAEIANAVTRGLNPNAPMKDSGIPWIGQIPEHWGIRRISHIFKRIGSGTTPESGNDEYYSPDGFYWLQTGDLNAGHVDNTSKKITQKALENTSLRFYPKGSVVVAMYGASIGNLAIIDIETTVNQACCVLSNCENDVTRDFVFYSLLVSKAALVGESKGGTQPNINQAKVRGHIVPFPPINEQTEIVQYIINKVKLIEDMKSNVKAKIDFLSEYKQRLIADVVTGQIKID